MLRNLALEREEFTHKVTKKTAEDIKLLNELMSMEKKASTETEEALLEMVKEIVNKIKEEIDGEKKMREASEDTILALLEETCGKLNLTAETGPS